MIWRCIFHACVYMLSGTWNRNPGQPWKMPQLANLHGTMPQNHNFDPHQELWLKPYQNHIGNRIKNHNCKTRPETNQNNKSYLNHIKNIKEHILKNLHPRDFGCYNGIDFGTAMTRPQTLRIQYECVKCVYKINRCIVWYNRTTISYIYIYTANAWVLPGPAMTTGDASSSSSSSTSCSST